MWKSFLFIFRAKYASSQSAELLLYMLNKHSLIIELRKRRTALCLVKARITENITSSHLCLFEILVFNSCRFYEDIQISQGVLSVGVDLYQCLTRRFYVPFTSCNRHSAFLQFCCIIHGQSRLKRKVIRVIIVHLPFLL